jgi:uncharacterized oxidoreductase
MNISSDRLQKLVAAIFTAAGCPEPEAQRIASHLVEANLVGHDSHGVIRVPTYVEWLRSGKVLANRTIRVVFENEAIAVVDGEFGFGQSIGEQAMELAIAKCSRHGVAVVALRNSGHLGRIGDWALMAARAGQLSLHFVNTSGAGILVAPFGGINRRISANPIAAGVPIKGRSPLILDISTCMVAEGKVRVALHKGVPVPDGCLIDAWGRPTNDPKALYGPPQGAILPVGGHKGYGLAILAEVLAGALTGGSCSNPETTRLSNGMLTIVMDPERFLPEPEYTQDVERFIAYVKSSEKVDPNGDILMPGEVEERTRVQRLREGIELAETTWQQIAQTCQMVQLPDSTLA